MFLFDEPLSNLDAELRVDMRVEIARLHKEIGATMIYVTHDQVEAMTLADKIVVLRAGYIEQVGAPLDLYRNPDNKFVAGFIGSPGMNFVGAEVKDGAVAIPALGTSVTPDIQMPAERTKLIVGLRPEHVSVGPGDTCTVDLTEALGGVSFDYVMAPSGERIIAEEKRDIRAKDGEKVGLEYDPANLYFFDAATEKRLR